MASGLGTYWHDLLPFHAAVLLTYWHDLLPHPYSLLMYHRVVAIEIGRG